MGHSREELFVPDEARSVGPDLVIAGAARAGTSALAAQMRAHPAIDAGTTKEPNFFSAEYDRGREWYDGLFRPRADGVVRMDASTSYTYPQHPQALTRLAETSPNVLVVYLVRDPVRRAVSHYLLRRYTLGIEEATTFGSALRSSSFYVDVSDYAHWLPALRQTFAADRLLIVPFEALLTSGHDVAMIICKRLGLKAPPAAPDTVAAHRNSVVEFRAKIIHRAVRRLRQSHVYPRVRAVLGAAHIRRLRSMLIRPAHIPTVEEALFSCDNEQQDELSKLESRAVATVREELRRQDSRTGLEWSSMWPLDLPQ